MIHLEVSVLNMEVTNLRWLMFVNKIIMGIVFVLFRVDVQFDATIGKEQ